MTTYEVSGALKFLDGDGDGSSLGLGRLWRLGSGIEEVESIFGHIERRWWGIVEPLMYRAMASYRASVLSMIVKLVAVAEGGASDEFGESARYSH
jgi:hypothetical protein